LGIENDEEFHSISSVQKGMSPMGLKRLFCLLLILTASFFGTRCATTQENLGAPGEMIPMMMDHDSPFMMTHSKDYVYPLIEINLENVIQENEGFKVVQENAIMVNDYYRGGVQEKAEGERLMKEEKWEEAEAHFEKSNWFLEVVVRYFPMDEACKNIYGDHVVIFIPNLLMADNELKLMEIYGKTKRNGDIYWAKRDGNAYLSRSLRSVKTEWGYRLKKDLEEKFKMGEALKK
jgi:hypothetical protein